MKWFAALLLSGWTALAQLPVIPFRPTPALVTTLPQQGSMYFHFIYNQQIYTNSGGNVTNWVDLIAGRQYTNYVGATVQWTPGGVFFGGTNASFLQSSNASSDNIVVDVNKHLSVVWIAGNMSFTPVGTFELCLAVANSGFGINGSSHVWDQNTGSGHTSLSSAITFSTNDVVFNDDQKFYTNGVLSATGVAWDSQTWSLLGANPGSSRFYKGYVFEAIGYTNIVLSSGDIAQIHQYSTNHYGGIP